MSYVLSGSMIIAYSRSDIKNSASSYSDSFLKNQKNRMINNNDNNNTYNKNTHSYSDKFAINSLDIADGLKELLIKHEFTLEELSDITSSELADLLGLDKYIAHIIIRSVTKLSNDNYSSYHGQNVDLPNK
jgi:hypothetical protein